MALSPRYEYIFIFISRLTHLGEDPVQLGRREATTAPTYGHQFFTNLCRDLHFDYKKLGLKMLSYTFSRKSQMYFWRIKMFCTYVFIL
jgi:hypothetical protein